MHKLAGSDDSAIVECVDLQSHHIVVSANKKRSLVFAHGLDRDIIDSWTHKGSGKCWIKDFLPDLFPDARILTSDTTHSNTFGKSSLTLFQHAEALVENLTRYRARPKVGAATSKSADP